VTKQVIYTDRVMKPIAHFSHAVRVGNVIHLGATAGTDAQRRLAGATPGLVDVAAQTRKMFENAATVLGLLGAGLEHVVRLKTYITDLRDLPVYEKLYAETFGNIRPNHVIVGSAGFPLPQAAIEFDLVAVVDSAVTRLPEAGDAAHAADRYYCTAGPASGDAPPPASFAAQMEEALRQLRARLAAGGFSLGDTVYLHVTLQDVRDAATCATAVKAFFPQPAPACVVVVAPLPKPDWMLQLEAVAVKGGGRPVRAGLSSTEFDLGTPAMLAGDELYIGGQFGRGAGVEAQTRAAWDRIRALLDAVGMDAAAILRTNNVLTDWRNYAGFNAGYGANVSEPYPPRTTVLGGLAQRDALVQIEALAHRHGGTATIVQAQG